jgi:hypothetical protein
LEEWGGFIGGGYRPRESEWTGTKGLVANGGCDLRVGANEAMLQILHRALRAAVIFLCHAFLVCALVFGAWSVDRFIHLLTGSGKILVYGMLPIS